MSSGRNLIRRREALAALTGLGFAPKLLRAELADPGPAMLPDYLAGRLNPLAAKWRAEVDGLRTADRARERNRFVRTKERELLGGFPSRTPLNSRVVKTTERDGYRIENVMYQ